MKKQIILLLLLLGGVTSLSAQIGINTENPSGILHVNPKKDALTTDDIVISTTGNLGIGTLNPINKVEIIGPTTSSTPLLRMTDGVSPAQNLRLVSDINGFGKWSTGTEIDRIIGDNLLGIEPTVPLLYSGKKITLTPGTWILRYNLTWGITPNYSANTTGIANIGILLSTSSTDALSYMIPGTWSLATVTYNQMYSSSQMSIYYTSTKTQTVYLWMYWNGDNVISSLTSYEPLGIGNGQTNMLDAVRW